MKERLHYVHDGPINGIPKIGQIRQEGKWDEMANGTKQSIARCIFNSRDEIENFFLLVSCFETRSRISTFQSHASRRNREFLSSLSCFETRPRRMFKKMHFCWEMASLIFKNIKFGQDCFLKLLLSLLSKCHFLTGHCVRRVKVKVASKGLVKTLFPIFWDFLQFHLSLYYRHIKAFKHPPDNQNLKLFLIICILNGKKEEEI